MFKSTNVAQALVIEQFWAQTPLQTYWQLIDAVTTKSPGGVHRLRSAKCRMCERAMHVDLKLLSFDIISYFSVLIYCTTHGTVPTSLHSHAHLKWVIKLTAGSVLLTKVTRLSMEDSRASFATICQMRGPALQTKTLNAKQSQGTLQEL